MVLREVSKIDVNYVKKAIQRSFSDKRENAFFEAFKITEK